MVFSIFAFSQIESEGLLKLLNLAPWWPVINAFQWGIFKKSKYLNKKYFLQIPNLYECQKSPFVEVSRFFEYALLKCIGNRPLGG